MNTNYAALDPGAGRERDLPHTPGSAPIGGRSDIESQQHQQLLDEIHILQTAVARLDNR